MPKRPLVICAILFFAGVMLAAFNLSALILASLLISVCGAYFLKRRYLTLFAVALTVALLGAARMNIAQNHRNSVVSSFGGKSATVSLTATEFSEDNKVIAYFNSADKKIKVYLSVGEDITLVPGDIVKGELSFSVPFADKGEINNFSNYLASEGFYLQAYAENVQIKGRLNHGFMGKIYSLRRYIDSLGERIFSGNHRALFGAMILGDKRLISDGLYTALQGSGLNHIAVVSGMHLTVAIALLMFFIKRIFGNLRVGYLFAILGAVFITLATGAGASVVRALIMCSVFYLSGILYRENDSLTSLFTAFWTMMLINPYIVFNVGFILSVLSVLGILLYSKKISRFLARFMPACVSDAMAITISAQLTLTPVIIYYFGIITPYAPLSNIPAVALSGIYVIAGMMLIVLSPIKHVAALLTPVMDFLASGIEAICFGISAIPYAIIEHSGNPLIFTLVWVFLIVLIYKRPLHPEKISNNKFSLQR